jgi:hypothetical protein
MPLTLPALAVSLAVLRSVPSVVPWSVPCERVQPEAPLRPSARRDGWKAVADPRADPRAEGRGRGTRARGDSRHQRMVRCWVVRRSAWGEGPMAGASRGAHSIP